jgi:hypothetical protein
MWTFVKNILLIGLATIELWWKSAWTKVQYVLDSIGLIKLPSDVGDIFGGAGMSPLGFILRWDDLFQNGPRVSEDFLVDRQQPQAEAREQP